MTLSVIPSWLWQNARKAFELRERVSERERFYIELHYYSFVTGDLEKARQTGELWAQTYPRDDLAAGDIGGIHGLLGQYDKALADFREALRLRASGGNYANLVGAYLTLNRFHEAQTTAQEAQAKNLDSPNLHSILYQIAFLQDDAPGMARQVSWAAGKPGIEDLMLSNEADTAAYHGQLGKARGLAQKAVVAQLAEKRTAAVMKPMLPCMKIYSAILPRHGGRLWRPWHFRQTGM